MQLPPDLLRRVERLGEDRKTIEWIANAEGIPFAGHFLDSLERTACLFESWFPRLLEFRDQAIPKRTSRIDRRVAEAIQRILTPKIINGERVPQRNAFTATIFSAPLCVHEILLDNWPGTNPNSVILTPEELQEWNATYKEHKDEINDDWWYTFQDWNVFVDPPAENFWLENCELETPAGSQSLLVVWGLQWGTLAGGHQSELWHLPKQGREQRIGFLEAVTY